jgi:hypothetical protein
MDFPSKAVVDVLTYLLPGFIAAGVVFYLTPAPRSVPFERVIQALIFTLVVQVLLILVRESAFVLGRRVVVAGIWSDDVRLVWSAALALLLGFGIAYAANTDRIHAVLRRMGITHQTSYSSEWYGAFCENRGFVVLHLTDQRRLYGWPEEWSSTPNAGHFVVSLAEWLEGDRRIPLPGVHRVMVRAADVEMVEFMHVVETQTTETEDGGAQGADAATTSATTAG